MNYFIYTSHHTRDMLTKCPVTCYKDIQNNNLWTIVTVQWQQTEGNELKIKALRWKLEFSFLGKTSGQTKRDVLKQKQLLYTIVNSVAKRPFPSSLVPLLQNESKCETFHMKMSSACSFIFMQIKVIFIRMVLHLDSLWNRGTRELGNGLFIESEANQRDKHHARQTSRKLSHDWLNFASEWLTILLVINSQTLKRF